MRKWSGIILLWLILYTLSANDNRTNFSFNHLSINERLPGANVYCVFQDQKGIIWFGIESVGLCKYNGKNFEIYSGIPGDTMSISDNYPLCIAEDTAGFLWIGTIDGLNRFDRQNGVFNRYHKSSESANSVPGNYIADLHFDRWNNLWIATRTGVSKYIPEQDKFYNFLTGEGPYTDGLPVWASVFYEDTKGNIWIGSYSSGLFLVDSVSNANHNAGKSELEVTRHWFPQLNEKDHEDNYAVQQICEYDEHSLLLGKIDGLCLFDIEKETFSRYDNRVNPAVNYNTVSALLKDRWGRLWVGYATKGLLFVDPEKDQQYFIDAGIYVPNGIRSNTIRDLYEDRSGLIWIAAKFQGIHIYDRRQEMLVSHRYNEILEKELGKRFILSIFEDSKNIIWFGTKNSGIYRFNPVDGEMINYSSENKHGKHYISSNRVECIIEDAFGNIWAGTMGGTQKLVSGSALFEAYDNYFIRCMEADQDGNIWIGTNSSGIIFYKAGEKNTSRFYSDRESDFFNDNTLGIISLLITSDSLLWISTIQNGLYKYDKRNDRISHYTTQSNEINSISGNSVRAVYKDGLSNLWIATKSKGLNRYNYETDDFLRIKQINGFPPNSIYNILQDKQNNYWMGTSLGLVRMNQKTGRYSLYNATYGLKSLVSEVNACCFTHDGLMLFGGSEGLNVFDPEVVHKETDAARLIISSVKVYDQAVAKDITDYSELSFDYKDKFITIEFALTDYSDPVKIQYKYKLENFDKDWIFSGNTNIATYTDLPPGKYVFKAMAANADNVWTNTPLSVALRISGPFWRNPIFIAFCILFSLAIAVYIHLYRLRFLRKNEIKLNELVKIKTRDLMDLNQELEENKSMLEEALDKAEESDRLKTAFLANLSHEIRTPMNGIQGFAQLLKEENLEPDQFQKYIEVIQKSSSRLLAIINDLVDISKIESGQIRINIESVPVNEILDELYAFFKPMAESKGLQLICKKSMNYLESIIMADRNRLSQILSNLIHNAIKYTTHGTITYGYTRKENEMEFYVLDTGKGIKPGMKDLIFERFRQIEDIENDFSEGSGLGLSISQAFVELHGGKIYVDSTIGKGSAFYFTIPYSIHEVEELEEKYKYESKKTVSFKGKKILVAEDDEYSYLYLRELLVKADLKVLYAEDGIRAIEIMDQNPDIDLILMDLRMPKLSGLKAARIIKSKYSNIPVVLQTAYALTLDKKKIHDENVDDYILKPIQKDELYAMISKHLN